MLKRMIFMVLALALVFGGLYGFNRFRAQKIAEFFANNKPPPTAISVAKAETEAMPRYLPGIGSLAAVHEVTVAPEVGGRVTQIIFHSGADVQAGDPLVQLNDRQEQADLLNFRAQARLAEANLRRSEELLHRQAAAQITVDQNQALLDQANAGTAKTQALIAQKLIRAPFNGVLGIRQVDLGQFVSPGSPLVTLTDLDTLFVNFTLPEQDRSRINVGQTVLINVDAYLDQTVEGKISTIEPQVSTETRVIKIQATMANPGRRLLPGMFARAQVVLPPQADVITVPETAVDYSLYGDSVFVVEQDSTVDAAKGTTNGNAPNRPALTVNRVYIKTGDRFANKVAVLQGLKPGDRVAASGQIKLKNGAAVTIVESNALTPPTVVPLN